MVRKYSSERELLDELMSNNRTRVAGPTSPGPAPDVIRLAKAPRARNPTPELSAKAEQIAQILESPDLSPNSVAYYHDDDPMPKGLWRKAARMAGELLHREIEVITVKGRLMAILHPNEAEAKAQIDRWHAVMDAMFEGRDDTPPPVERKYR